MKDFTLKSILQSVLVVIDKLSAEWSPVLENFVDSTTKKFPFIILFLGGRSTFLWKIHICADT